MGRQERFVAFGPEDAPLNFVQAVLKVAGHNWVDDQHSRSTWPMHYTGYLTTSLPKLQRPEGRIRLAGSDFANGWGGFIDGAIESGLNAARAVGSSWLPRQPSTPSPTRRDNQYRRHKTNIAS